MHRQLDCGNHKEAKWMKRNKKIDSFNWFLYLFTHCFWIFPRNQTESVWPSISNWFLIPWFLNWFSEQPIRTKKPFVTFWTIGIQWGRCLDRIEVPRSRRCSPRCGSSWNTNTEKHSLVTFEEILNKIASTYYWFGTTQGSTTLNADPTGLPNKVSPRLRDSACWCSGKITQPRTSLIREPCRVGI